MDACIGGEVFWLIGYAFSLGGDDDGPFIGFSNFALSDEDGTKYSFFFFQFAFTATAAVKNHHHYHPHEPASILISVPITITRN